MLEDLLVYKNEFLCLFKYFEFQKTKVNFKVCSRQISKNLMINYQKFLEFLQLNRIDFR